jgi:hypothetical protein
MTNVLLRRRERQTHMVRILCEGRGRYWSESAARQECQGLARHGGTSCNPSYSGGRSEKITSLRPAQAKKQEVSKINK